MSQLTVPPGTPAGATLQCAGKLSHGLLEVSLHAACSRSAEVWLGPFSRAECPAGEVLFTQGDSLRIDLALSRFAVGGVSVQLVLPPNVQPGDILTLDAQHQITRIQRPHVREGCNCGLWCTRPQDSGRHGQTGSDYAV